MTFTNLLFSQLTVLISEDVNDHFVARSALSGAHLEMSWTVKVAPHAGAIPVRTDNIHIQS